MVKQRAFSMPEMLMALSVIGLIGLILLGSILTSNNKATINARLYDEIYNDVYTATKASLVVDKKNTLLLKNDAEELRDDITKRLDVENKWSGAELWENPNGLASEITDEPDKLQGVTLNNGMKLAFVGAGGNSISFADKLKSVGALVDTSDDLVGAVLVDTNGKSGPNVAGQDQYAIPIYTYGLGEKPSNVAIATASGGGKTGSTPGGGGGTPGGGGDTPGGGGDTPGGGGDTPGGGGDTPGGGGDTHGGGDKCTLTSASCGVGRHLDSANCVCVCDAKSCGVNKSQNMSTCECECDIDEKTCKINTYFDDCSCKACPGNSHGIKVGATSLTDGCACDIGYYLDGDSCKACPGNSHGLKDGATSITDGCACNDGTFGNVKTGCEPCPEGTYWVKAGETQDEACKPCPAGTKQNNAGQTSCENCNNGAYQDKEGQTSCELCPCGTYTPDDKKPHAACAECGENEYAPEGSAGCTKNTDKCKFVSPNKCFAQESCPAGSYKNEGDGMCPLCPIGYFKAECGNEACEKCPDRLTTAKEGATACICAADGTPANGYYWDKSKTDSFPVCQTPCPRDESEIKAWMLEHQKLFEQNDNLIYDHIGVGCVRECSNPERPNSEKMDCALILTNEDCTNDPSYGPHYISNGTECVCGLTLEKCKAQGYKSFEEEICKCDCRKQAFDAKPGQYFDEEHCKFLPCPAGTYQNAEGKTSCTSCSNVITGQTCAKYSGGSCTKYNYEYNGYNNITGATSCDVCEDKPDTTKSIPADHSDCIYTCKPEKSAYTYDTYPNCGCPEGTDRTKEAYPWYINGMDKDPVNMHVCLCSWDPTDKRYGYIKILGMDECVYLYDPLMLDKNYNGKIDTAFNCGVDISNDGSIKLCASQGDKMLAINELNTTNTINGSKIFGTETINPFKNLEPINAINGFEALGVLAFDAFDYAAEHNIDAQVIDIDGNYDLYALQKVLNAIGWDIGFISDNNITVLEPLGDVISISGDYTNSMFDVTSLGEGQHAVETQTGFFKTIDGILHKAADIMAVIIKKFSPQK